MARRACSRDHRPRRARRQAGGRNVGPMCGIAGVVERAGASPRSRGDLAALAQRMADRLAHRGPDGSGRWEDVDAGVAFAQRRLAVIDLSPTGAQPMTSASGRYVIVCNGELYNFRALRATLEAQGVRFRGTCDTEVLLGAIETWGLHEALERANGMFAFALWDTRDRTLQLVRDRLGEKPCYYGWAGSAFVFASECKALRAHPAFAAPVDRSVLGSYLRFGYVPQPWCIYEGFRQLPAGSVLTLGPAMRPATLPEPVPYWDARVAVERSAASPFGGSPEDAIDALDELLRDSVRLRLESDVPLGAFLSGGIDSSTVVALMQAQSTTPVRTFSIGSPIEGYDEAVDARAVAKHLGTDHTEVYVTPEEALAVVPELPAVYDEPFADPSQVPTLLVSRLARQSVTVSLSGDGGDELFAGYNRYVLGRAVWKRARHVPPPVRRAASRMLGGISTTTWDRAHTFMSRVPSGARMRTPGDKIAKLVDVVGERDADAMYVALASAWRDPASVVIGATEAATVVGDPTAWPALDETSRMMFCDLVSYIPGDSLVKLDRASMAVALEARVPLLDHRLVEFAWQLPLDWKLRNGVSKWALRQVLARYVPTELVDRPKMGFDLPIDAWLRGPLRDWAEGLLSERRLRDDGYFRAEPVRRAWDEHCRGTRNWSYRLWAVLMFQAWRASIGDK
ncbi:MAG: asparagine synthase, glutamine-hydrolyzing [Actinomycetia bacterium]|nr:asparagine synthase, glutamine-hydrolyzing [Actinomycetes bacterium]